MLLQERKSVYYVCLSMDERARHMIRDDLTSGWLKQVWHEDVVLTSGGKIRGCVTGWESELVDGQLSF